MLWHFPISNIHCTKARIGKVSALAASKNECLSTSINFNSIMDCELLFNPNVSDSSIAFTLEKKKGHPYHILLFCSDCLEMQILLFLFSSLCFSTFYPSFQAPPPASYKSQFLIGGYALGISKLGQ